MTTGNKMAVVHICLENTVYLCRVSFLLSLPKLLPVLKGLIASALAVHVLLDYCQSNDTRVEEITINIKS